MEKKMSEKEKMFLVQCLLEDIRGNWAEKVIKRTLLAKRLCLELGGEFDELP